MKTLLYATLGTYLPVFLGQAIEVSVQDIFYDFCLNWFKLVSAQPPNSQTFNQKKYCCFHHQDFGTKYFFFLWFDDVYRAKGQTEVDISVQQSWIQLYLKILMYMCGCLWWIYLLYTSTPLNDLQEYLSFFFF